MIGIYAIKNIINGKLYIGLSSKIEKRFLYHKKCLIKNKHLNKHLQSSFNKIGIDNFEFYIIEECSIEELNDKEKYYIDLYKTYDNNYGYNKTYGGGFGKMSEEINEQRRQKLKLQVVSHEMRKRISNTLTGRIIPKEVVEKRALACRKCSDEIEEKIIELYKEKTQKEISIVLDIKVTTVVSVLNRHKIKKKIKKMKKNKMLPTIALMGTCNGSTWRDELIPKLNIKYYNPVVENWTPECQEEEIRQREICDFLLYVITPKMTGVFAIAELVQDSNKRPEKTIFCFLEKDGNVQFGEHQIKSLNAVARMVEENGSFVFLDLDDVALYLNSFNLPQ